MPARTRADFGGDPDPEKLFESYIEDVFSGRRLAGKMERLKVERHVRDLAANEYTFDRSMIGRIDRWFRLMRHHKGEYAGKPLLLEPWQLFDYASLLGWKRPDGTRRFRTAYNQLARKNGKTTGGAGLMSYGTVADGEGGAENYSAATTEKQANISFAGGKQTVKTSEHLGRILKTYAKSIHHPASDSTWQPLASNPESLDGLNPHFVLADELHAWKDRLLWDVIDSAMGARPQPLMMVITTPGQSRQTICFEQYDYSRKVLEQVVTDDTHFAAIYECEPDAGDDWRDLGVYPKANPNWNVSVRPDFVQSKISKALVIPAEIQTVQRMYAGLWAGNAAAWITADSWADCAAELPDLTGRPCHLGIDLGWKDDLASIAATWDLGGGEAVGQQWSWCPDDGSRDLTRPPFDALIAEGRLRLTEGDTTDMDALYAWIEHLIEVYGVRSLAFDGNNARQFGQTCQDRYGIVCFPFYQGPTKYNEPTRELSRVVRRGEFTHDGDPLLAWAVSNVQLKTDPRDRVMPDKGRSSEKIDPVCALIMSYSELMFHRAEGLKGEAYNDEGGGVLTF